MEEKKRIRSGDLNTGTEGKESHMAEQEGLAEIADPKFREMCAQVVQDMERLHVPGAVVGVLFEGEEQIRGFGVTSVDHPLPVYAATLFQIGSITKTFVGTLIMRLVEQGKVALDAPLRTYLPDLRLSDASVAERVTLRHLLTHTGGWVGDYFDDCGFGDDALAQIVARVANLPQLTPLGEVWSYNNSGFYLAGRVIEVVTGRPFETAMQELILDPLGMKQSFFFAHDVITKRFAVGHNVKEDIPEVANPWSIGRAAHPAVQTSPPAGWAARPLPHGRRNYRRRRRTAVWPGSASAAASTSGSSSTARGVETQRVVNSPRPFASTRVSAIL